MASLFFAVRAESELGAESFLLSPAFPPGGFVLRLSRSWGENPSTACGGPPPFGKGGWRRTGLRAMNKGAFAVPKGSGAGRRPAEGGFIRPPNLAFPPGGFVLRLRRSWGQNPSTGCAGPPPFSKGGLWRTGPRISPAPLAKGGWSWPKACGGGIHPPDLRKP